MPDQRTKDNMSLCLDAVAYAKGQAPRSANQTYFKRGGDKQARKRYTFLLGMTRTTEFAPQGYEKDGQWKTKFIGTNDESKNRRQLIQDLLRSNKSVKQVQDQIDKYIKAWGEDYFWGNWKSGKIQEEAWGRDQRKGLGINSPGSLLGDWVLKYSGLSPQDLKDLHDQGTDEWDYAEKISDLMQSAEYASKSGIGNCDEKAQLASKWILEHAPGGGQRLAMCFLDPEYAGWFGSSARDEDGRTKGGGDHVFAVYDCNPPPTGPLWKVKDMGPYAIICDGWMNDAYPAQHHSLLGGFRSNYNKEIINVKQSVVRDMICISYRKNIRYRWNFVLPMGKKANDPKPDRAKLARDTEQYKTIVKGGK